MWANYNLIIMYSNIGTPNNHLFSFGTNGKVVVLGVPILKHFRVPKYMSHRFLLGCTLQCCWETSKERNA